MAYLIGWGSPFDADDHTYKVFGTDKGANYSSYSNALVDQYLIEARESADPAVRAEAYDKFQEELAKDPAFTFICYIDANYVANSSIQGISADTVMGHHGVGIFWWTGHSRGISEGKAGLSVSRGYGKWNSRGT